MVEQDSSDNTKLNLVQIHLLKNAKNIELGLFAPNIFDIASEVFGTLLKPFFFVLIMGLIVFSTATSSAWFSYSSKSASLLNGSELDVNIPNEEKISDKSINQGNTVSDIDNTEISESVGTRSTELEPVVTAAEEQSAKMLAEEEAKQAAQLAEMLAKEIEPLKLPPRNQTQQTSSVITESKPLFRGISKSQIGRLHKYNGLIEFISGVIAVYYPAIDDPGEIAQQIVKVSIEEGIDPLYIASIISTESSFKANAKSYMGARGLMQLLPSTAADVASRKMDFVRSMHLYNPSDNLRLGISYLKELEQKYSGSRYLALAAYNWGLANVDRAADTGQRLPRSVHEYSTDILKKTVRWQRHFRLASSSARQFQIQSTELK